jgi:hypothetical protein
MVEPAFFKVMGVLLVLVGLGSILTPICAVWGPEILEFNPRRVRQVVDVACPRCHKRRRQAAGEGSCENGGLALRIEWVTAGAARRKSPPAP